jgi:hypothetical protein
LDRRKRTTASEIKIWYITVIEPDRDEPRHVRMTQSQLFDCQDKFFVLIALLTRNASAGKAGNKNERVLGNRVSNHHAPVLAGPKVSRIPPHRDSCRIERSL